MKVRRPDPAAAPVDGTAGRPPGLNRMAAASKKEARNARCRPKKDIYQ
jgi:hypothetical protein